MLHWPGRGMGVNDSTRNLLRLLRVMQAPSRSESVSLFFSAVCERFFKSAAI